MGVSNRHILNQGKVLGALGRTALLALRQRGAETGATPQLPGPEVHSEQAALPQSLLDAYIRHVGGEPRSYRGEVPPHLFPQWCMPVLARSLEGLPYPLLSVLNGGCNVRIAAPIPAGEPIVVRARLESIDDDGRRAVLRQAVVTGTSSTPEALSIDFFAVVPLRRAPQPGPKPARKEKATVPTDVRELARLGFASDAGLSFAKLTGDFNPIHWLPPYARASGHRSVILHGFATLAHSWEALNRALFGGDVHALREIDAKLTRPLSLPHEVGLYTQGSQLFVGDLPGGPAYLTGRFTQAVDGAHS